MSLAGAALAVGKGAIALGKAIASLAPKAGAIVSSGIIKAGGSAAAAKAAGQLATLGTAMLVSKGIDKATDVTVKKIPAIGHALDTVVDLSSDIVVLGGMMK